MAGKARSESRWQWWPSREERALVEECTEFLAAVAADMRTGSSLPADNSVWLAPLAWGTVDDLVRISKRRTITLMEFSWLDFQAIIAASLLRHHSYCDAALRAAQQEIVQPFLTSLRTGSLGPAGAAHALVYRLGENRRATTPGKATRLGEDW